MLEHPRGKRARVEYFEVAAAVKTVLTGDDALTAEDGVQESDKVEGLQVTIPYADDDHDNRGRVEQRNHALNAAKRLTRLRNHLVIRQWIPVASAEDEQDRDCDEWRQCVVQ